MDRVRLLDLDFLWFSVLIGLIDVFDKHTARLSLDCKPLKSLKLFKPNPSLDGPENTAKPLSLSITMKPRWRPSRPSKSQKRHHC